MNRHALYLAAVLLVSLPGPVFAAPGFLVQDLGDLDGGEDYSRAYGMNALGEVVGESSMSYAPNAETAVLLGDNFAWSGIRGFVWTQKTISEVGLVTRLTGQSVHQYTLVGSSGPATPANNTWSLDTRSSGSARAIDDSGNIYIESGRRGWNEFSAWPTGTVTSQVAFTGPPALASRMIASLNGVNAVSGNGIVGGFDSSGAATWSAQTGSRPLPDGSSSGSGGPFVFGIPSTMVNGVNNAGIAVGVSKGLPVWWDAQAQLHEIEVPQTASGYFDPCAGLPSGWSFSEAVAINDAGQIAANATRNGITHAFLLSPVPEPSASWMFLAGLAALATRRIAKRDSVGQGLATRIRRLRAPLFS